VQPKPGGSPTSEPGQNGRIAVGKIRLRYVLSYGKLKNGVVVQSKVCQG
jgi:hypothetical protein